MDLQHVNVKLLLEKSAVAGLAPLIPVFHAWIQGQIFDELLLDVADYSHVPEGPGIVLIGHGADYSVDNTDGRVGVRYNRKAVLNGDNQDRLAQATRAALRACKRLESEPRLEGKVRFSGKELEIFINDRLIAPNMEATREEFRPELHKFLQRLFGGGEFALTYGADPRRLFGVRVSSSRSFSVSELLANVEA